MSRVVVFLDTSVLVEVLRVPGKSQRSEEILLELRERTDAGQSLILPTAAIIETGNHIAQLGSGTQRRTLAERFAKLLESTVAPAAPWVLNGARWDGSLLTAISRGARGCPPLPEMAAQGIGTGDVSILAEAEAYSARVTHVDVRIWTLERLLAAYA
jgi:predicted nucleic acid-binding protein